MRYARVKLIGRPVAELANGLTYSVPDTMDRIQEGSLVIVPLRQEKAQGIVVEITEAIPQFATRPILSLSDLNSPTLKADQLELVEWLADYYMAHWSNALDVVWPPIARINVKRVPQAERLTWGEAIEGVELSSINLGRGKIQQFWQHLISSGQNAWYIKDLRAWEEYDSAYVRKLTQEKLLSPYEARMRKVSPPILTPSQVRALKEIEEEYASAMARPVLLNGVTGSGKTEIYLQLIEQCMQKKQSVLVLVPEITLTVQLVERFRSRLGDQVVVMHSSLSDTERAIGWQNAKNGLVRVVVGARSAIFAPLQNLGLIILDEEHEQSYKHEEDPKYHAKEVALWRARKTGACVLLGSATPAIDSYQRAITGYFRLVTLAERVQARPMAKVAIVDMREELRDGNKSIFSHLLQKELADVVRKKEQAILFHNRRGRHRTTICRTCGYVVKCPSCEMPLIEHLADVSSGVSSLRCHLCGYEQDLPSVCPECSSKYLRFFGIGTEKVVEECEKLFPDARVLRLDADSAAARGSKNRIVRSFGERQAEILVGTQMVAKGLDFPAVTLVGIVSADSLLNAPDYRGAERAYALLTQVAGRAGRGELPGRVVLQSYNPDQPIIDAVCSQDYPAFFREEIFRRQRLNDPPFAYFSWLVASSENPHSAFLLLQEIATRMKGKLEIRGPQAARIYRLSGRYRYQLILKDNDREKMLMIMKQVIKTQTIPSEVSLSVTLEPLSF